MTVVLLKLILAPKKIADFALECTETSTNLNSLRSDCNFLESCVSVRDFEWYPVRGSSSNRSGVMSILILKCKISKAPENLTPYLRFGYVGAPQQNRSTPPTLRQTDGFRPLLNTFAKGGFACFPLTCLKNSDTSKCQKSDPNYLITPYLRFGHVGAPQQNRFTPPTFQQMDGFRPLLYTFAKGVFARFPLTCIKKLGQLKKSKI